MTVLGVVVIETVEVAGVGVGEAATVASVGEVAVVPQPGIHKTRAGNAHKESFRDRVIAIPFISEREGNATS